MRRPGYLALLARLLIPKSDREFILGDLDELYAKRVREEGRLTADLRFLKDVFLSGFVRHLGRKPRHPDYGPGMWRRNHAVRDVAADTRHALRSLRRRPGFTLMVVSTLALGIGPTAAVFGMMEQLILRPLPGVANSRVTAYLRFQAPGTNAGLTLLDFDEVREGATLLEGVASYGFSTQNVALDNGRPISVLANMIYGDFFEVLGVKPAAGRLLSSSETDLDGNPLVVVISESLQSRLFGPGEEVVGRAVRMNGQSVTIVGVAGGGFTGPERGREVEAWLPHAALVPLVGFAPERLRSRESVMHSRVLILPRPLATVEAAEAQLAEILTRLKAAIPESAEYLSQLQPKIYGGLHTPPFVRDTTSRTLRMMGWAVVLILAIACANVANLLLFRNLAHRGRFATLRALGASTGRVARQQVAESLLLGVLGAVSGLGVAWLITLPFRGEQLVRMPAFEGFGLNWAIIGFVTVTAVVTTIFFGVVPAALAGRFDLGAALRASRTRETGRVGVLRTALSTGQIALTLALVVGGLLMVRTIANLYSVETGLDIDAVVSVSVEAPDLQPDELIVLERELLAAAEALPGVERAALDVHGPHGSRTVARIGLPGAMAPQETLASRTTLWQVTPGWFELFGLQPINGRTFQDADWRVPSSDAIVLTASLARRLFGRTDVVGLPVLTGGRNPVQRRVTGVVGDYRSLLSPGEPTDAFFVPYGASRVSYITLLAKTRPSDIDVATQIRGVVESFFPDSPVPDPVPLTARVEDVHRERRLLSRLLLILSGFGILMSTVGLYGAIHFAVSSRTREFGIRLALGADRDRILRLVARSALTIVFAGTALGLLAAYTLALVLQSRLFGVGTFDLTSYVGAAALLMAVAVLACLAPARAALGTDPVATLRQD